VPDQTGRISLNATVRILGIDPGSRQTGWAIIDHRGMRCTLVAAGRISLTESAIAPRLVRIDQEIAALAAEHQPDEAAIEETFVNRVNAASALVLGQARGVAICALARAGLSVAEYAPSQVKMAVTGSGRSDKIAVQTMVRRLLSIEQELSADAADAVAIALTHASVRGLQLKTGGQLRRRWR